MGTPLPSCCHVVPEHVSPHMVSSLPFCSVHRVGLAVQAGGHLEGLDELRRSHTTGTLRDDACEAHLSLHVDLDPCQRWKSDKKTENYVDPGVKEKGSGLTSIHGFLSWAAELQALTRPLLWRRESSGPQRCRPRRL